MNPRPTSSTARPGRATSRHGSRYPRGWEVTSDDYEAVLLTLPPDVTRVTASMRLSIEAEFGGWELSRVRLYSDGTRKVLLKRKRPRGHESPGQKTPGQKTMGHDQPVHDQQGTDEDPGRGAQAC